MVLMLALHVFFIYLINIILLARTFPNKTICDTESHVVKEMEESSQEKKNISKTKKMVTQKSTGGKQLYPDKDLQNETTDDITQRSHKHSFESMFYICDNIIYFIKHIYICATEEVMAEARLKAVYYLYWKTTGKFIIF